LRRNEKICAKAPEFAREAVTYIQRDAQRRRGYRHAERQRRRRQ
jgi:hypothetical protein